MSESNDSERAYERFCDGRVHLEHGRHREAMACFLQSLELAEHFKARELLGECQLQLGDAEAAAASLQRAVAGNRGARPRVLFAKALVALGRTDEARAALEEALQLQPGHGPARAALQALSV